MVKTFITVIIIVGLLSLLPGYSFAQETAQALPALPDRQAGVRQGFGFQNNQTRIRKTDEIIIKFKKQPRTKDLIALSQKAPGLIPRHGVSGTRSMVYQVSGSVDETIATLSTNPDIEAVVANRQMQLLALPNDPAIQATPMPGRPELQWNMYKLRLAGPGTTGWDLSHGSAQVKVAVIDSGVDMNHQDLAGKIVEMANCAGVSACQAVASMTDGSQFGHGTHVAGLVAATTNNGVDISGAGYDSRLVILKVVRSDGSIYVSDFVTAIRYGADRGVQVINLSIGATTGNLNSTLISEINSAVDYAWSKGILVVAAAGNCGGPASGHDPNGDSCDVFDSNGNFVLHEVNPKVYPGASPNVLSVAALTVTDTIANYSERNDSANGAIGNWISVAAPGGASNSSCSTSTASGGDGYNCILSLWPGNSLAYNMGTSMASPQVAGVAALIFAAKPGVSGAQVKQYLETTANKSIGRPQANNGMVDAFAALTAASGSPSPTITANPSPTTPASPSPTLSPSPIPSIGLSPTRIPSVVSSPTTYNPQPTTISRPTDIPRLPKTPPNPYPTGPFCPIVR